MVYHSYRETSYARDSTNHLNNINKLCMGYIIMSIICNITLRNIGLEGCRRSGRSPWFVNKFQLNLTLLNIELNWQFWSKISIAEQKTLNILWRRPLFSHQRLYVFSVDNGTIIKNYAGDNGSSESCFFSFISWKLNCDFL